MAKTSAYPNRTWLIIWGVVGGALTVCALYLVKRLLVWMETRESWPKPVKLTSYPLFAVAVVLFTLGAVSSGIPEAAQNGDVIASCVSLVGVGILGPIGLQNPHTLPGWVALAAGLLGTGATFGLPQTVHDSGVDLGTSLYFFALCGLLAAAFTTIEFIHWRCWARGLSSSHSALDRRLLLFLVAGLVALLQRANSLVLTVIMFEVDVQALGNAIVSFVLIFGLNTLIVGYYSVLALHDYDLSAVVASFVAFRHLTIVVEALLFGQAEVGSLEDAAITLVLPLVGVALLTLSLFALWRRDNFSALHLFDPFAYSFIEVTLFGSCLPKRAAFYDPDFLTASTSESDTSFFDSISDFDDAYDDDYSGYSATATAATATATATASTASASEENEEEEEEDSTATCTASNSDRADTIALRAQKSKVKYAVAASAIANHKPVPPGYHWNLPLSRTRDATPLPRRCDGVHVMRAHYSWFMRAALVTAYLTVISVLYFGITLILMVSLYRTCPEPSNESVFLDPVSSWAPLPLADDVPFSRLRVLATHNSYHLAPRKVFPGFNVGARFWQYSHKTLSDQLADGVRGFELDPHVRSDVASVWHANLWDDFGVCKCFATCLREMRGWSRAHPGHVPIVVQLEFKSKWFADLVAGVNGVTMEELNIIERDILRILGRSALFIPDDLRGNATDLPAALAAADPPGWPRLGDLRSKFIFVLDDTGATRASYLAPSPVLANRLMFTIITPSERTLASTAVIKANSPMGSESLISEFVAQGFLVRTRGDTQDLTNQRDEPRGLAANASMAQIVSFDWSPAAKWEDWFTGSLLACVDLSPANITSGPPCNPSWQWEPTA